MKIGKEVAMKANFTGQLENVRISVRFVFSPLYTKKVWAGVELNLTKWSF